jgi:hypothetical protein
MALRQTGQSNLFNMQRIAFVSDERLAWELERRAHLAADDGVIGIGDVPMGDVDGTLAGVLGSNLYGTLCGAKNKGPFWPQADKLDKTSHAKVTVMIRGKENIN